MMDVATYHSGSRLTLGGCKAPSRGEGRARPGLPAGLLSPQRIRP